MQVRRHVGTGGMIDDAADPGIGAVREGCLARNELAAAIRTIVPNGIKSVNHGTTHFV
jgi:hypothetical protein